MGHTAGPSFFRRVTLCKMRMCPARSASDEVACWGECVICGRQSGYISRKAIRRYMDAQESDAAFIARMVREGHVTPDEAAKATAASLPLAEEVGS